MMIYRFFLEGKRAPSRLLRKQIERYKGPEPIIIYGISPTARLPNQRISLTSTPSQLSYSFTIIQASCAELDGNDMRLAEMPYNLYLGMYEHANSFVFCRGSPRARPIAPHEIAQAVDTGLYPLQTSGCWFHA